MTIARVAVVAALFAITSLARIGSQSPAPQPCGMPQLPTVSKEANMFSPEQARVLGGLILDRVLRNYALVGDARLDAYLQAIADRMAATAGVGHVAVQLFDSPRVDGFTFPGGHILVSRKLVAFVKNEDELAGMLAQEIGHVVSNDNERKVSAEWRDVLKVTSVGDAKDVEDKYNQWIENAAQAYRDLWDRYRGRQGSTGSWLTDFVGITMPDPRRLPVSLEAVAAMPGSCVGTRATSQAQFAAWQADVLNARRAVPAPSLSGVIAQRKLDPPLRPDITRLSFSPDGKWVLAQNPAGVYVFSRDPLALTVRIEAADARPAQFTPDSTGVVFHDRNLRVERWSITTGQLRVLTRGFRGAGFDASRRAYLDLPAEGREQRAIVRVDPVSKAVEPLVGIDAPDLTNARAAPSLQAAQGRPAMGQTVIGTEIVQCGNYLVGWRPRQKTAEPFTIAVHEAGTGRPLWARTLQAQPGVMRAEPEHGTLVLEWSVLSGEGKAIVAANPDMKARVETAKRVAEKDRWRTASFVPASLSVFEFLNVATGAPIGRLLVDYGNGSFRMTPLAAAGEHVIAGDTENRTLVFSLATGREVARTFGTPLAVSGDGSLVLVQNAAGETGVYSVPALEKRQDLVFPSRVRYARFGEGARVLFVLTDDQTAYTIAVGTQEPTTGGQ
jgi:hypothetical protein